MTRYDRLLVLCIGSVIAVCLVVLMQVTPPAPEYAARPVPAAPPRVTTTAEPVVSAVSVPEPAAPAALSATTAPRETTGAPAGSGSIARWYALADCESGEWARSGDPTSARPGSARWDDRRNGYEGGVHFLPDTWRRAGGHVFAAHAYQATALEQIEVARTWLARTSVRQWPTCGPAVGLTMADAAKGEVQP